MTEKPRNTEAALIEMREAADTLNRWAREYYVCLLYTSDAADE